MKRLLLIGLALAPALALPSCSSVGYTDPDRLQQLDIDYSLSDLRTLAGRMSDSMIASSALQYYEGKEGDPRIIVYVGDVENRTSEHIDTQGITDDMRESLLNSGKFRLSASRQGQDEIGNQVEFQQGGRVNAETAKAFGAQVGADMVLYGTLRSLSQEETRSFENLGTKKENLSYQFSLTLSNITTGEDVWVKSEYLSKTKKTGLFGG